MKGKEKTKKQLIKEIDSLQKQIKKFEKLKPRLKHKEKELKEFDRTLEERMDYRTSTDRIVHKQLHNEIEQRKQSERTIQDTLEYANGIINTVREPLLVLNADLRIISASRSFYQIFKVKPGETEKQLIYDLGNRQWDIPKLRHLLENIMPKTTSFDNFEVEHDFPDIGKRIMLLNACRIYLEANRTKLIVLTIEDITERKKIEELREKIRELEAQLKKKP